MSKQKGCKESRANHGVEVVWGKLGPHRRQEAWQQMTVSMWNVLKKVSRHLYPQIQEKVKE